MGRIIKKHIKKYCDKHDFPIDLNGFCNIFNIKNSHPILSKLYPQGYGIIYKRYSEIWWKNGKRHRDGDEPAVIRSNGEKQWWKNGQFIKDNF